MTPGAIVRGVGAYPGHFLISFLNGKRFDSQSSSQNASTSMMEYIHQIFAAPGRSGEHALQYLVAPPDWNFYPISGELPKLKQVSVYFVYGKGEATLDFERVKQIHDKIDKVSLNPVREVVEMEGGHHLYLENPDGFNQKVVEFCTDKGRRYSNLHGLDEEIGNL